MRRVNSSLRKDGKKLNIRVRSDNVSQNRSHSFCSRTSLSEVRSKEKHRQSSALLCSASFVFLLFFWNPKFLSALNFGIFHTWKNCFLCPTQHNSHAIDLWIKYNFWSFFLFLFFPHLIPSQVLDSQCLRSAASSFREGN